MRALRRRILLASLAAAVVVAPQGAAAVAPRITEGNAVFPDRTYILSLPSQAQIVRRDVDVRENGERVANLTVVPAREAGSRQLGVVLVIDTSNSMKGEPIAGAMRAARAFAARRNARQQLAVVTFNRTYDVLLPFTNDREAIAGALAGTPPLAQGTQIYDGVAAALELFDESSIESGSIVVLSDGADTGSRALRAAVAEHARASHVRVFTVGLRSKEFDERALSRLADAAGGRYAVAASTRELEQLFGDLGARLANEYLVQYRSLAGPQRRVVVEIRVRGFEGVARSGYITPALPKVSAPPYRKPLSTRFWDSPLTLLFISALCAGLIAYGLLTILRPRNRTLRKRMAEFVAVTTPEEGDRQSAMLTQKVFTGTERSLGRTRWWTRFKEELAIAEINIPPAQIVIWTIIATIFAMLFLRFLLGPIGAFLGLGVPFVVRAVIKRRLAKIRRRFSEQLADNLQVLASALRAGHSFVGALSVVTEDAEQPSKREFQRVVADEQLGRSLEDALDVVVERMACPDLEQVSVVAALGRETGGNTAEVLDRVTETIQERFRLRREIDTLTAQGRLARWIVSALPVFLLLAITALNPTYVSPLYNESAGRILLVIAAVMVILGSLVIKRIVDIKV